MPSNYRVELDFSGKVAVITGAGQGIGRAIARTFASHRAAVVVSDLDRERSDAVADEIRTAGGVAVSVQADVTNGDDIASLMAGSLGFGDKIDILIHNAAYFPLVPFEEITPQILDRTLDVNLKAAFWLTRAALPYLLKSTEGRILMTSSVTGPRVAYPGLAHYAASKAGLNGFIRSAALELAKHRITVNGVEPGMIKTPASDLLGDAELQDDIAAGVPLKRLGDPREIAAGMLFLACDAASYITGQTIVIDGGALLPER